MNMSVSAGTGPTNNHVAVNTASLATMIDRANNAVRIGLIQSWTPSTTDDSIVIVVQPTTAQIVTDSGGTSAYNTRVALYFSQWGHTVT